MKQSAGQPKMHKGARVGSGKEDHKMKNPVKAGKSSMGAANDRSNQGVKGGSRKPKFNQRENLTYLSLNGSCADIPVITPEKVFNFTSYSEIKELMQKDFSACFRYAESSGCREIITELTKEDLSSGIEFYFAPRSLKSFEEAAELIIKSNLKSHPLIYSQHGRAQYVIKVKQTDQDSEDQNSGASNKITTVCAVEVSQLERLIAHSRQQTGEARYYLLAKLPKRYPSIRIYDIQIDSSNEKGALTVSDIYALYKIMNYQYATDVAEQKDIERLVAYKNIGLTCGDKDCLEHHEMINKHATYLRNTVEPEEMEDNNIYIGSRPPRKCELCKGQLTTFEEDGYKGIDCADCQYYAYVVAEADVDNFVYEFGKQVFVGGNSTKAYISGMRSVIATSIDCFNVCKRVDKKTQQVISKMEREMWLERDLDLDLVCYDHDVDHEEYDCSDIEALLIPETVESLPLRTVINLEHHAAYKYEIGTFTHNNNFRDLQGKFRNLDDNQEEGKYLGKLSDRKAYMTIDMEGENIVMVANCTERGDIGVVSNIKAVGEAIPLDNAMSFKKVMQIPEEKHKQYIYKFIGFDSFEMYHLNKRFNIAQTETFVGCICATEIGINYLPKVPMYNEPAIVINGQETGDRDVYLYYQGEQSGLEKFLDNNAQRTVEIQQMPIGSGIKNVISFNHKCKFANRKEKLESRVTYTDVGNFQELTKEHIKDILSCKYKKVYLKGNNFLIDNIVRQIYNDDLDIYIYREISGEDTTDDEESVKDETEDEDEEEDPTSDEEKIEKAKALKQAKQQQKAEEKQNEKTSRIVSFNEMYNYTYTEEQQRIYKKTVETNVVTQDEYSVIVSLKRTPAFKRIELSRLNIVEDVQEEIIPSIEKGDDNKTLIEDIKESSESSEEEDYLNKTFVFESTKSIQEGNGNDNKPITEIDIKENGNDNKPIVIESTKSIQNVSINNTEVVSQDTKGLKSTEELVLAEANGHKQNRELEVESNTSHKNKNNINKIVKNYPVNQSWSAIVSGTATVPSQDKSESNLTTSNAGSSTTTYNVPTLGDTVGIENEFNCHIEQGLVDVTLNKEGNIAYKYGKNMNRQFSNLHFRRITYGGTIFPSVEHCYKANKAAKAGIMLPGDFLKKSGLEVAGLVKTPCREFNKINFNVMLEIIETNIEQYKNLFKAAEGRRVYEDGNNSVWESKNGYMAKIYDHLMEKYYTFDFNEQDTDNYPSNIVFTKGDFNTIKPNQDRVFIAHQTSGACKAPKGLAEALFKMNPKANYYGKRDETVGTYKIHHGKYNIINMVGQRNQADRGNSTRKIEYFDTILSNLPVDTKNDDVIIFPYLIGCGLAMGSWRQYLECIVKYAVKNPEVKVVINEFSKDNLQGQIENVKDRTPTFELTDKLREAAYNRGMLSLIKDIDQMREVIAARKDAYIEETRPIQCEPVYKETETVVLSKSQRKNKNRKSRKSKQSFEVTEIDYSTTEFDTTEPEAVVSSEDESTKKMKKFKDVLDTYMPITEEREEKPAMIIDQVDSPAANIDYNIKFISGKPAHQLYLAEEDNKEDWKELYKRYEALLNKEVIKEEVTIVSDEIMPLETIYEVTSSEEREEEPVLDIQEAIMTESSEDECNYNTTLVFESKKLNQDIDNNVNKTISGSEEQIQKDNGSVNKATRSFTPTPEQHEIVMETTEALEIEDIESIEIIQHRPGTDVAEQVLESIIDEVVDIANSEAVEELVAEGIESQEDIDEVYEEEEESLDNKFDTLEKIAKFEAETLAKAKFVFMPSDTETESEYTGSEYTGSDYTEYTETDSNVEVEDDRPVLQVEHTQVNVYESTESSESCLDSTTTSSVQYQEEIDINEDRTNAVFENSVYVSQDDKINTTEKLIKEITKNDERVIACKDNKRIEISYQEVKNYEEDHIIYYPAVAPTKLAITYLKQEKGKQVIIRGVDHKFKADRTFYYNITPSAAPIKPGLDIESEAFIDSQIITGEEDNMDVGIVAANRYYPATDKKMRKSKYITAYTNWTKNTFSKGYFDLVYFNTLSKFNKIQYINMLVENSNDVCDNMLYNLYIETRDQRYIELLEKQPVVYTVKNTIRSFIGTAAEANHYLNMYEANCKVDEQVIRILNLVFRTEQLTKNLQATNNGLRAIIEFYLNTNVEQYTKNLILYKYINCYIKTMNYRFNIGELLAQFMNTLDENHLYELLSLVARKDKDLGAALNQPMYNCKIKTTNNACIDCGTTTKYTYDNKPHCGCIRRPTKCANRRINCVYCGLDATYMDEYTEKCDNHRFNVITSKMSKTYCQCGKPATENSGDTVSCGSCYQPTVLDHIPFYKGFINGIMTVTSILSSIYYSISTYETSVGTHHGRKDHPSYYQETEYIKCNECKVYRDKQFNQCHNCTPRTCTMDSINILYGFLNEKVQALWPIRYICIALIVIFSYKTQIGGYAGIYTHKDQMHVILNYIYLFYLIVKLYLTLDTSFNICGLYLLNPYTMRFGNNINTCRTGLSDTLLAIVMTSQITSYYNASSWYLSEHFLELVFYELCYKISKPFLLALTIGRLFDYASINRCSEQFVYTSVTLTMSYIIIASIVFIAINNKTIMDYVTRDVRFCTLCRRKHFGRCDLETEYVLNYSTIRREDCKRVIILGDINEESKYKLNIDNVEHELIVVHKEHKYFDEPHISNIKINEYTFVMDLPKFVNMTAKTELVFNGNSFKLDKTFKESQHQDKLMETKIRSTYTINNLLLTSKIIHINLDTLQDNVDWLEKYIKENNCIIYYCITKDIEHKRTENAISNRSFITCTIYFSLIGFAAYTIAPEYKFTHKVVVYIILFIRAMLGVKDNTVHNKTVQLILYLITGTYYVSVGWQELLLAVMSHTYGYSHNYFGLYLVFRYVDYKEIKSVLKFVLGYCIIYLTGSVFLGLLFLIPAEMKISSIPTYITMLTRNPQSLVVDCNIYEYALNITLIMLTNNLQYNIDLFVALILALVYLLSVKQVMKATLIIIYTILNSYFYFTATHRLDVYLRIILDKGINGVYKDYITGGISVTNDKVALLSVLICVLTYMIVLNHKSYMSLKKIDMLYYISIPAITLCLTPHFIYVSSSISLTVILKDLTSYLYQKFKLKNLNSYLKYFKMTIIAIATVLVASRIYNNESPTMLTEITQSKALNINYNNNKTLELNVPKYTLEDNFDITFASVLNIKGSATPPGVEYNRIGNTYHITINEDGVTCANTAVISGEYTIPSKIDCTINKGHTVYNRRWGTDGIPGEWICDQGWFTRGHMLPRQAGGRARYHNCVPQTERQNLNIVAVENQLVKDIESYGKSQYTVITNIFEARDNYKIFVTGENRPVIEFGKILGMQLRIVNSVEEANSVINTFGPIMIQAERRIIDHFPYIVCDKLETSNTYYINGHYITEYRPSTRIEYPQVNIYHAYDLKQRINVAQEIFCNINQYPVIRELIPYEYQWAAQLTADACTMLHSIESGQLLNINIDGMDMQYLQYIIKIAGLLNRAYSHDLIQITRGFSKFGKTIMPKVYAQQCKYIVETSEYPILPIKTITPAKEICYNSKNYAFAIARARSMKVQLSDGHCGLNEDAITVTLDTDCVEYEMTLVNGERKRETGVVDLYDQYNHAYEYFYTAYTNGLDNSKLNIKCAHTRGLEIDYYQGQQHVASCNMHSLERTMDFDYDKVMMGNEIVQHLNASIKYQPRYENVQYQDYSEYKPMQVLTNEIDCTENNVLEQCSLENIKPGYYNHEHIPTSRISFMVKKEPSSYVQLVLNSKENKNNDIASIPKILKDYFKYIVKVDYNLNINVVNKYEAYKFGKYYRFPINMEDKADSLPTPAVFVNTPSEECGRLSIYTGYSDTLCTETKLLCGSKAYKVNDLSKIYGIEHYILPICIPFVTTAIEEVDIEEDINVQIKRLSRNGFNPRIELDTAFGSISYKWLNFAVSPVLYVKTEVTNEAINIESRLYYNNEKISDNNGFTITIDELEDIDNAYIKTIYVNFKYFGTKHYLNIRQKFNELISNGRVELLANLIMIILTIALYKILETLSLGFISTYVIRELMCALYQSYMGYTHIISHLNISYQFIHYILQISSFVISQSVKNNVEYGPLKRIMITIMFIADIYIVIEKSFNWILIVIIVVVIYFVVYIYRTFNLQIWDKVNVANIETVALYYNTYCQQIGSNGKPRPAMEIYSELVNTPISWKNNAIKFKTEVCVAYMNKNGIQYTPYEYKGFIYYVSYFAATIGLKGIVKFINSIFGFTVLPVNKPESATINNKPLQSPLPILNAVSKYVKEDPLTNGNTMCITTNIGTIHCGHGFNSKSDTAAQEQFKKTPGNTVEDGVFLSQEKSSLQLMEVPIQGLEAYSYIRNLWYKGRICRDGTHNFSTSPGDSGVAIFTIHNNQVFLVGQHQVGHNDGYSNYANPIRMCNGKLRPIVLSCNYANTGKDYIRQATGGLCKSIAINPIEAIDYIIKNPTKGPNYDNKTFGYELKKIGITGTLAENREYISSFKPDILAVLRANLPYISDKDSDCENEIVTTLKQLVIDVNYKTNVVGGYIDWIDTSFASGGNYLNSYVDILASSMYFSLVCYIPFIVSTIFKGSYSHLISPSLTGLTLTSIIVNILKQYLYLVIDTEYINTVTFFLTMIYMLTAFFKKHSVSKRSFVIQVIIHALINLYPIITYCTMAVLLFVIVFFKNNKPKNNKFNMTKEVEGKVIVETLKVTEDPVIVQQDINKILSSIIKQVIALCGTPDFYDITKDLKNLLNKNNIRDLNEIVEKSRTLIKAAKTHAQIENKSQELEALEICIDYIEALHNGTDVEFVKEAVNKYLSSTGDQLATIYSCNKDLSAVKALYQLTLPGVKQIESKLEFDNLDFYKNYSNVNIVDLDLEFVEKNITWLSEQYEVLATDKTSAKYYNRAMNDIKTIKNKLAKKEAEDQRKRQDELRNLLKNYRANSAVAAKEEAIVIQNRNKSHVLMNAIQKLENVLDGIKTEVDVSKLIRDLDALIVNPNADTIYINNEGLNYSTTGEDAYRVQDQYEGYYITGLILSEESQLPSYPMQGAKGIAILSRTFVAYMHCECGAHTTDAGDYSQFVHLHQGTGHGPHISNCSYQAPTFYMQLQHHNSCIKDRLCTCTSKKVKLCDGHHITSINIEALLCNQTEAYEPTNVHGSTGTNKPYVIRNNEQIRLEKNGIVLYSNIKTGQCTEEINIKGVTLYRYPGAGEHINKYLEEYQDYLNYYANRVESVYQVDKINGKAYVGNDMIAVHDSKAKENYISEGNLKWILTPKAKEWDIQPTDLLYDDIDNADVRVQVIMQEGTSEGTYNPDKIKAYATSKLTKDEDYYTIQAKVYGDEESIMYINIQKGVEPYYSLIYNTLGVPNNCQNTRDAVYQLYKPEHQVVEQVFRLSPKSRKRKY